MRGAHGFIPFPGRRIRIIPADAGSTKLSTTMIWGPRDHPRGCGEHAFVSGLFPLDSGSSPRMRGAQEAKGTPEFDHRIIPADAGSTGLDLPKCHRMMDHPRGCGEHCWSLAMARESGGSSPRMRGAPMDRKAVGWPVGIIPADAGSTLRPRPLTQDRRDHPRGCGEHG